MACDRPPGRTGQVAVLSMDLTGRMERLRNCSAAAAGMSAAADGMYAVADAGGWAASVVARSL
jgi:hypothetical protein